MFVVFTEKKISVFVLGSGDSLKKALITIILGKDISQLSKRNSLNNTEIYENDTYEVTCTPDLNTECEDMREVFDINQNPDMCLLVVEEGFSPDEVSKTIKQLQEETGKPTEEFVVVLPHRSKHTESYPFKSYTMGCLFSELSRLAEGRHLVSTDKR